MTDTFLFIINIKSNLRSIYHAFVVIYKLKFTKYSIENFAFFKRCNSLALEKFPGQSKIKNNNNNNNIENISKLIYFSLKAQSFSK